MWLIDKLIALGSFMWRVCRRRGAKKPKITAQAYWYDRWHCEFHFPKLIGSLDEQCWVMVVTVLNDGERTLFLDPPMVGWRVGQTVSFDPVKVAVNGVGGIQPSEKRIYTLTPTGPGKRYVRPNRMADVEIGLKTHDGKLIKTIKGADITWHVGPSTEIPES